MVSRFLCLFVLGDFLVGDGWFVGVVSGLWCFVYFRSL